MSSYPLLNTQNGRTWDISANNVNLVSLNGNGTSGQILSSNGPTLAPSWITSPASTIAVTDTSTAGTYYPTFVSASGAGQTLRADTTSNPLSYNPSTGVLTSTSVVASGAAVTNTISSNSMVIANAGGSVTLNQSSLTASSGYTINSGGPALLLQAANSSASTTVTARANYTGAGGGTSDLALVSGLGAGGQSVNLNCNDSSRNYSVLNMKSGDINLYAGTPTAGKIIQAGVQFQQAADIYFAVDTSNTVVTNSYYISRVDTNGWKWGIVNQAGLYPLPPPTNPTITTPLMQLVTAGYVSFPAAGSGVLEKSIINLNTTTDITLTTADSFSTNIINPAAARTVTLPALPGQAAGVWYGICNKSNNIITVRATITGVLTTISTISGAGSQAAGSSSRYAVAVGGGSYFCPSQ
jgi:hypothetical protein